MWLSMSPAPLWAVLAPSHGDGELAASGLLMCTLCKYVFPVASRAFPSFTVQPHFVYLNSSRQQSCSAIGETDYEDEAAASSSTCTSLWSCKAQLC